MKYWTAQAAAKLVLTQLRLGQMRAELVRVSIQGIIAEKLIGRAVESICTGLRDQVDHAARGAADFSGVQVGNDANLRDGLDGRTDTDRALQPLVIVHPVDRLIVHEIGLTIHGNVRGGSSIARAGTAG